MEKINFNVCEVDVRVAMADNSHVQLGCFGDGQEGDMNLC